MKKIVVLMMALILCLSLVACGSKEKNKINESNSEPVSTNEQVNNKDDNPSSDFEEELTLLYKVPMKNVFINAPNYQEIEEGYTELFIVHESKFVAITSDRKATANNSKDAHSIAFEKFKTNMQNYEGGVNGIAIKNEETIKINGIDVYSFEGTINYGTDNIYDGFVKGYSFVMDGIPVEILGSVIDKAQPQQLIDEISIVVEKMVKTARESE